jgi:hypothetical protein
VPNKFLHVIIHPQTLKTVKMLLSFLPQSGQVMWFLFVYLSGLSAVRLGRTPRPVVTTMSFPPIYILLPSLLPTTTAICFF